MTPIRRAPTLARVLALAAALVCANAVAAAQDAKDAEDAWTLTAPQVIDEAAVAAAPASSAGCLVVGYRILRDGSVSKPRIMQGAFLRETPAGFQQAFGRAAVQAAGAWTYAWARPGSDPDATFEWTVVGYVPASTRAAGRVVLGEQDQDARVRDACRIGTLWEWGNRNAVAVASTPDHGGKVIFADRDSGAAYWVPVGTLPTPPYPPLAFRRAIEGCVVVGLTIQKDGTPSEFRVMDSRVSLPKAGSVKTLLEDVTLRTAARWRFAPGPDNLQRVPALLQFPVRFTIDAPPRLLPCEAMDPDDATGGG